MATGQSESDIAIDPSGKFAYVVSFTSFIAPYSIGANGNLTALNPDTVGMGPNGPVSVAIDPSGKYAWATNAGNNSISQYAIGANGNLTALSAGLVFTAVGPWSVSVEPSGTYVYVPTLGNASTHSTISRYAVGTDGSLTAADTLDFAPGTSPDSITITLDPSEKYAYVAHSGGNTVSQFTVGADGTLTPMATAFLPVSGARSIAIVGSYQ